MTHPASQYYTTEGGERMLKNRPDLLDSEREFCFDNDYTPDQRATELLNSSYGRSGGSALDRVIVALHRAKINDRVLPRSACIEHNNDCNGDVEYRTPLSGTGKAFPRCEFHWDRRLAKQEEFNQRDADARNVDYLDAGERYEED